MVLASAAFLPLLAPRLLPVLALVTLLPLLSKEPGQGALLLHYLLVPSLVALVIALVVAREPQGRPPPLGDASSVPKGALRC